MQLAEKILGKSILYLLIAIIIAVAFFYSQSVSMIKSHEGEKINNPVETNNR